MLIEEVSESEKDIISSGLFLELVFNFMAFHETIKVGAQFKIFEKYSWQL